MLDNFSKYGSTPLNDLRLIDFGSGSGAYDELLLKKGNIEHITLVDASKTMLKKAQQRLENAGLGDRSEIINEYFNSIPRDEYVYYDVLNKRLPNLFSESYTAAMTSMVIHHLVHTGDDGQVHDWSPIVSAFTEANRVLKGRYIFFDEFHSLRVLSRLFLDL